MLEPILPIPEVLPFSAIYPLLLEDFLLSHSMAFRLETLKSFLLHKFRKTTGGQIVCCATSVLQS